MSEQALECVRGTWRCGGMTEDWLTKGGTAAVRYRSTAAINGGIWSKRASQSVKRKR